MQGIFLGLKAKVYAFDSLIEGIMDENRYTKN